MYVKSTNVMTMNTIIGISLLGALTMTIAGEDLLVAGAWILLFGTIIETVGQTAQTFTETDDGKTLVISGNSIEAFGNSLQAIGRTKLIENKATPSEFYSIFGSSLEAVGNTGNAVGIALEVNGDEEGMTIDTLGSGIQGLGAALEGFGAYLEEDSSFRSLSITGNSFISFGSFLNAIGNIYITQDQEDTGELILLIANYIQLVGSTMLVVSITFEVESLAAEKTGHNFSNYYNFNKHHHEFFL